jgi:hypothetical protein
MYCTVDWSALGTWVTGVGAVSLAVIAHRAAAAAAKRADERALRSARALAVSAAIEVHQRHAQTNVVEQHLSELLNAPGPVALLVARTVAEQVLPFSMSEWLLTAPSLGDLPENVSVKLTSVAASSAHADNIVRLSRAALDSSEMFEAGGKPTVVEVVRAMRTLRVQYEDLAPYLDRIARTHVTPSHPRVDGEGKESGGSPA